MKNLLPYGILVNMGSGRPSSFNLWLWTAKWELGHSCSPDQVTEGQTLHRFAFGRFLRSFGTQSHD